MSRAGFYGKDQSEARKTGSDRPILPCKDLFLGNTTSGSDIALLKEGNITSGGDIALFFFFFFFLRRKTGTAVKKMYMCSVCFYRKSVDEGDFNLWKEAQRVLPWHKKLSKVLLPTLSCNYVEL